MKVWRTYLVIPSYHCPERCLLSTPTMHIMEVVSLVLDNAISIYASVVEPGREKLCMLKLKFLFTQFGLLLCIIGSSRLCSHIASPH